jgi:hypothetical protein
LYEQRFKIWCPRCNRRGHLPRMCPGNNE